MNIFLVEVIFKEEKNEHWTYGQTSNNYLRDEALKEKELNERT